MTLKLKHVISDSTNPYRNLAYEEQLTFNTGEDECILYLWQNANTVVIGKNQNPWNECNVKELEGNRGLVARRMSGGGAVYHDLGNLNFTFTARKQNFDKVKQTEVILRAVEMLGINAVKSGRNDLLINGKKFSGHAYYAYKDYCYHHGTVMFDVNKEDVSKYLNVSKAKLNSKGVSSVKSRVINLKEIKENITLDMLKDALLKAFEEVYGGKSEPLKAYELKEDLINKYESYDWIYGKNLSFDYEINNRFDWGEVNVRIGINEGIINSCECCSDSLDVDLPVMIEEHLIGKRYKAEELAVSEKEACPMMQDVIKYVRSMI